MNKKEYISRIEKALVGKVSAQELHDTIQYYRDYIDMEIRKGRAEKEVLEQLGDPRLLAKTIAMTKGQEDRVGEDADHEKKNTTKTHHIPLIAVIAIVILVFMLAASLMLTVMRILIPIILPVILLVFIWRYMRKK